eukprot:5259256-Pyramimonas_sp.AAC.2
MRTFRPHRRAASHQPPLAGPLDATPLHVANPDVLRGHSSVVARRIWGSGVLRVRPYRYWHRRTRKTKPYCSRETYLPGVRGTRKTKPYCSRETYLPGVRGVVGKNEGGGKGGATRRGHTHMGRRSRSAWMWRWWRRRRCGGSPGQRCDHPDGTS